MKKDNLKIQGEAKIVVIRDEKNKASIPCIQMGEHIYPIAVRMGDPQKGYAGEWHSFLGGGLHNLRLVDGVLHEDEEENPKG